jgi:hypothetical protein
MSCHGLSRWLHHLCYRLVCVIFPPFVYLYSVVDLRSVHQLIRFEERSLQIRMHNIADTDASTVSPLLLLFLTLLLLLLLIKYYC